MKGKHIEIETKIRLHILSFFAYVIKNLKVYI
jgi:hypothetical protein